jgi:hypothetical protein
MSEQERRRIIADRILSKPLAAGVPMPDDADFRGLVDLWVSGEIDADGMRERYGEVVEARKLNRRIARQVAIDHAANAQTLPLAVPVFDVPVFDVVEEPAAIAEVPFDDQVASLRHEVDQEWASPSGDGVPLTLRTSGLEEIEEAEPLGPSEDAEPAVPATAPEQSVEDDFVMELERILKLRGSEPEVVVSPVGKDG